MHNSGAVSHSLFCLIVRSFPGGEFRGGTPRIQWNRNCHELYLLKMGRGYDFMQITSDFPLAATLLL